MAYRTTRAKGFRPTLKNPQKRTILRSDAVQHRRYWRRRYWWTWPGEIPEKLAPLYWWRCPGCYCFPTDFMSFQPSGDTLSDHIRTRCELDLTAETIGLEGWENAALRAIHYDEGSATWVIAGGAKEEEGIGVTGGVRAAYSKDNGHTWFDISEKFQETNHKKQDGDSREESSGENYDFVHALASDGAGNWVAVGGYSASWDDSGARIWYAHNVADEWKFATEATDGEEGGEPEEESNEPGYIPGIGSAITAVTFGDGVFISGCGDTASNTESESAGTKETPRGICLVSADKGETWYFPQENKREEDEESSELISGRFYDIEVNCGYWIGCGYNRVDKSERVCYISGDRGETWYPWTFNGVTWTKEEETEDTEDTEEDEGINTTYPDELKFRTLTYVEDCDIWLAGCEGNNDDYPMGTLWYSDGPGVDEEGNPSIDFIPLINYVPNLATTDILAVGGSQLLPEGAGAVNVCDMQIMAIGYNNPENTDTDEDTEGDETPGTDADTNTGLMYITNSCDTRSGSGDCNSWFFKNENASDFPELHCIRFGARTYLGVGDDGALFRGTPQMSIITDESSGSITGTVYSCSNWWVCGRTGSISIRPHYGISGETEVTISWNTAGEEDERLELELCNKDGGKTSIIINYTTELDYDRPANYLDVSIDAEDKDYSVVMSAFSLNIERLAQAAWRTVYYDEKTGIWLVGGGLSTTSGGAVTGGLAAAMSEDGGQTWTDITDNFPVVDYPSEGEEGEQSGERESFIHSITSDGNGTYVAVGGRGTSSNAAGIWYTKDLGGCWHFATIGEGGGTDTDTGEDTGTAGDCQETGDGNGNGNGSSGTDAGKLDDAGNGIQYVTYDPLTSLFISGTGVSSPYKCLTSSDGKTWKYPEKENENTAQTVAEESKGEPETHQHGSRFFQIACVDPSELESEETEGTEDDEEKPKSLWVACGSSNSSNSSTHPHEAHDDTYWSEDEGKTWTPWAFNEPRPKPDAGEDNSSNDERYTYWRSVVWVPRCKLFLAAGASSDTAGQIWMSKDGKTWCHMKGVTGNTLHTRFLNVPEEGLTVAIGYTNTTTTTTAEEAEEEEKDPCAEGGGGNPGDGEIYTLFGCPSSGETTEGEEGENKCVCPETYTSEGEGDEENLPSCLEWVQTESGDLYRLYWVDYGNGVYIGAGNCGSLFIGSVALTIFTGNSSDCATGTVDSGSNWYVCETHLQNEGDTLQLTPRAGGCDETDVQLCWSFKGNETGGGGNNPQRGWIRICNNGGNSTYITVVYTPGSNSEEGAE